MFWNVVDAFNSTQYTILKSYFLKSIIFLCFSDVNKWHRFIYILKKRKKVINMGIKWKVLTRWLWCHFPRWPRAGNKDCPLKCAPDPRGESTARSIPFVANWVWWRRASLSSSGREQPRMNKQTTYREIPTLRDLRFAEILHVRVQVLGPCLL